MGSLNCSSGVRDVESMSLKGQAPRIVGFPLRGEWIAVNTPAHRIPSHGTDYLAQRYAYDFVMTDYQGHIFVAQADVKYLFGRIPVRDSRAWAQPVIAPLSGTVVDARDGWRDRSELNFFRDWFRSTLVPALQRGHDWRSLTGNYVIIQWEETFFLLAHLRCGSLRVRTGGFISEGEVLGEVGNSYQNAFYE